MSETAVVLLSLKPSSEPKLPCNMRVAWQLRFRAEYTRGGSGYWTYIWPMLWKASMFLVHKNNHETCQIYICWRDNQINDLRLKFCTILGFLEAWFCTIFWCLFIPFLKLPTYLKALKQKTMIFSLCCRWTDASFHVDGLQHLSCQWWNPMESHLVAVYFNPYGMNLKKQCGWSLSGKSNEQGAKKTIGANSTQKNKQLQ